MVITMMTATITTTATITHRAYIRGFFKGVGHQPLPDWRSILFGRGARPAEERVERVPHDEMAASPQALLRAERRLPVHAGSARATDASPAQLVPRPLARHQLDRIHREQPRQVGRRSLVINGVRCRKNDDILRCHNIVVVVRLHPLMGRIHRVAASNKSSFLSVAFRVAST